MFELDPWWAILGLWSTILCLTLLKKYAEMRAQRSRSQELKGDFMDLHSLLQELCTAESLVQQDDWYYGKHKSLPLHLWISFKMEGLILRIHTHLDEVLPMIEMSLEKKTKQRNDEYKPGHILVSENQIFDHYMLYQKNKSKKEKLSKDQQQYLSKIIRTPGDISLKKMKYDGKSIIFHFVLYDLNPYSIQRLLESVMSYPIVQNSNKIDCVENPKEQTNPLENQPLQL